MRWLILVLLAVGGVWLYSRLRSLEEEIHAEIEHDKEVRRAEHESTASGVSQVEEISNSAADPTASLEEMILQVIRSSPGISQTELYAHFTDHGKSQLQKTLRDMARDGLIRRERKGSSYKLFAV